MKYFSLEGKKISIFVAIVFIFFGHVTIVVAAEMISGVEIKKKINSFLIKKNLLGEPSISETRLFPACSSDILVKPMFGGLKTVELLCSDPGGLKIAVRTNAVRIAGENIDSRVETGLNFQSQNSFNFKPLLSVDKLESEPLSNKFLALSRSVQKGHILTIKDVMLKNTRASNLTGHYTDSSDVIGRKVKRTLSINQVLLNRHLEIDWDIRKGQKILIQSASGPVVVVSSGISRDDARIGELLEAENLQSGTLVEGIVVSQKKIKVLTK